MSDQNFDSPPDAQRACSPLGTEALHVHCTEDKVWLVPDRKVIDRKAS